MLKKSQRWRYRYITLTLCAALLMSIISPAAFATESSPDEASKAEVTIPMQPDVEEPLANTIGDLSPEELATAKLEAKDIPEIIYSKDVEEEGHVNRLRAQEPDLCSVIFQNRDGTKSLYSFTYPVKYKDENGVVQDKSTELTATTDKKGYGFVNAKNDIKTWYPDSLQLDRGMALEADGIAVELSPISATENKKETARKAVSALAQKVRVSDEKGSSGDAVEYAGVFGDNTSIRYSSTFEGFKEDIIFEANMGINRFSFKLKTGGLSLIKDEDGQYCLTDPSTGECKVSIGELVVTDSRPVPDFKTKYNHFYEVQTVEPDNEYIITAVVDEEYLNSPDTVYPVTVDPTLTVRQTSGSQSRVANDATLYSKQPNLKTGSFNNLWVGNDSGGLNSQGTNYGKERILIKFPTLVSALQSAGITNNMITEARLYMFLSSSATPAATIDAYMFGHSWSESSVTYNNADWNDYTSYQDSTRIQSSSYDYWWWGITGAVKKWRAGQYGGSSNYGLIMISQDESVANKDHSFYSSNYTTISKRPYVKVTYDNTLGQAPGITSGQIYFIRNANSGKYLDVKNGNIEVVQYFFNGGTHQRWKVVYESDGYYSLSPVGSSSKVLDLSNGFTSNGNPLWIYGKWSSGLPESDAQRFEIIKVGTVNGANKYKIVSKKDANKVVEVQSASTGDNAVVQLWNYDNKTRQEWFVEPANKTVKTNSNSTVNSGYNRGDAADYAYEYGPNPNTNYYDYFEGANCTNFVSQCLHYGGMGYIPSNVLVLITDKSNTANWFYVKNLAGMHWYSVSWTSATNFNKHWGQSNMRAFQTIEYANGSEALKDIDFLIWYLKKGDVIQLKNDDGTLWHSMVICNDNINCDTCHKGVSGSCNNYGKKELLYAQNTDDFNNGHLRKLLNGREDKIVFTKIKKDV